MHEYAIQHYVTAAGRDVFGAWIAELPNRQAAAAILIRVGRLQRGLFGDCKPVGGGVSELRVDIGAGYRVYFARAGIRILVLLCGGDKRLQHDDIARAKRYWATWKGDGDAD